ncbi:hypothetical protein JCM10213_004856 [Rhodosporidiobolus nylandii]
MTANPEASAYAFLKTADSLQAGGANWKGFRLRMSTAFSLAGVSAIVDGTRNCPAESDAAGRTRWEEQERSARGILLSKLENEELEQVVGLNVAEAWAFFVNKYEMAPKDTYKSILATLNLLCVSNDGEVEDYIQKQEQLLARARDSKFPLVDTPAATASDEQKGRTTALNMVYSDKILAGLPPSADWRTFAQIYDADPNATWAPREVIDKIRAHHQSNQARSTTAANNPLFPSSSASGTALASPSNDRPPCPHCKAVKPRHSVESCWQNPGNPNNRLGRRSEQKGNGSRPRGAAAAAASSDEQSDGNGTVHLSFAIATTKEFSHDPEAWYLDSCATHSIAHSRSSFSSYAPLDTSISTANGEGMKVVGKGDVELMALVGAEKRKVVVSGVLHVPSSGFNLISVPRIQSAGLTVTFEPDSSFRVKKGSVDVFQGSKQDYSLPKISLVTSSVVSALIPSAEGRLRAVKKFHRIYGHPGKGAMRHLLKSEAIGGFTTTDIDKFHESSCKPCRVGKSTKLPYLSLSEKPKKALDGLHADIAGPFQFESFSGCRCFVILVDAASGHIEAEPMKEKSETLSKVRAMLDRMELEARDTERADGRYFQSDNGAEFTSWAFKDMLAERGFVQRLSVPYTPQQNGRAERAVRTLKEKITTLLAKADLSRRWWAEVLYYAVFLLNSTPDSLTGVSPYFFLHNKHHPFLSRHAPIIGQSVWVNNPSATTVEDKAVECRFLGIGVGRGVKGVRVQPVTSTGGNDVRWARDVYYDRGEVEDLSRAADDDEDDLLWGGEAKGGEVEKVNPPRVGDAQPQKTAGDDAGKGGKLSKAQEFGDEALGKKYGAPEGASRTRSGKVINLGAVLSSPATFEVDETDEDTITIVRNHRDPDIAEDVVLLVRASKKIDLKGRAPPTTPKNAEEALSGPYGVEWREGMQEEIDGFAIQDAGKLVPFEDGMKVLGTRWHLSVRPDADGDAVELKSRGIVQGMSFLPFLSQYGSTYTPLPNWGVVSIFLKVAVENDLEIWCTDLKKGYLAARVAEGAEPIYIRQFPGFEVKGKEDHVLRLNRAVYGLPHSGRQLHLRITDAIEEFLGGFTDEFDVKVRGALDGGVFLGREVEYGDGKAVVRVEAQIAKALKTQGYEDIKPMHTPIQPGVSYEKNLGEAYKKDEYLSGVGKLNFIALTRPDIQHAVSVLGRYSSNPGEEHHQLMKRVFAYLSGTRKVGLEIRKEGNVSSLGVKAYVDADFAGDVSTRRSTTGRVIQVGNSTVFTFSRRQPTVSPSTYHAELTAISAAFSEAEHISSLLAPLNMFTSSPITVLNDNLSAVQKLNSPSFSEETKHLDVKVKKMREQIERGFAKLEWIPSAANVANLLTKLLPARKAKALGEQIGLVGWPSGPEKWGSR